jgi:hypothetical protein
MFDDGPDEQRIRVRSDFRRLVPPDVRFDHDCLSLFDVPVHSAHQFDGFVEHGVRFPVFHSHKVRKTGSGILGEHLSGASEQKGPAGSDAYGQTSFDKFTPVRFFYLVHRNLVFAQSHIFRVLPDSSC